MFKVRCMCTLSVLTEVGHNQAGYVAALVGKMAENGRWPPAVFQTTLTQFD